MICYRAGLQINWAPIAAWEFFNEKNIYFHSLEKTLLSKALFTNSICLQPFFQSIREAYVVFNLPFLLLASLDICLLA